MMVDTNGVVEIKDFTLPPPRRFRIDDDVFELVPELPLHVMQQATRLTSGASTGDVEPILAFFDLVLVDTAAARFRARVGTAERPNKTNPIGIRHIMAILPWLLEEYGLRPLTPSADSSGTSDGTSVSSTAGAPSVGLTPGSFPATGS